jgi:DNA polymerase III epsilon subunit-like protein
MKNKKCFIDVETTGLNSAVHEIIEIALIIEGEEGLHRYSTKIKPKYPEHADPRALEVNGFSHEEWRDAPYDMEVAEEIASLIEDKILIGHNVHFDAEFVEELLHKCGCKYAPRRRKIDTITLAHEHLYFWPAHSLSSLRLFFGIPTDGEHRALKDCQDMRDIYYRLLRAPAWKRAYWNLRSKYITWMWKKAKK